MILKAFSVRDVLTGFTTPDFKINEQVALRDFDYIVNNQTGLLNAKPEDYSLFLVGEFNTDTGEFIPCEKKLIVEGVSIIRKEV